MKKRILLGAFLFAGTAYGFAKNSKMEILLTADPCTVTVTQNCAGSGSVVTATQTSPTGDCNAAYTVANEQWNTNCHAATIRKVIESLTPPDQP